MRRSAELGLPVRGVLTGTQLDPLDGEALTAALPATAVFAWRPSRCRA